MGVARLLANYPIPILLLTDVLLNLNRMLIAIDVSFLLGNLTLISCLSRQYSGLDLSPTLPTLLPASDIPNQCTIGGLLHDYRNPPPTDYFCIFPTIRSILQP